MLKVENLTISFNKNVVVNNVSFEINTKTDGSSNIEGIVGESGSGKTMTALAIAGLLPENAKCTGKIWIDNILISELPYNERKKLSGNRISMIFQEPMTSLNPVYPVGMQVEEMLVLHSEMTKEERKKRVIDIFTEVELQEPQLVYDKYPHELSGGMRQRVMIAIALICEPELILADEPTTALDADTEKQIVSLLLKINKEHKTAILFISHNLGLIKKICKNVLVMYKGNIEESGSTEYIFENPQKEYTRKLIDSIKKDKKKILPNENDFLLEVRNLSIYYYEKGKGLWAKKRKHYLTNNLNIEVREGEIVGILGKSGCGKTTLLKAILGLHPLYEGEIIHNSKMPQMIFQDPFSSLNPTRKVSWILEEPLRINTRLNKAERQNRVVETLKKVGLDSKYADRFPRELSGGQRQRVSIALSLILGSKLVVADEPVSALDVTVQKQIMELLLELQHELGLTIIFISHDRNVMQKMCDRVLEWKEISNI